MCSFLEKESTKGGKFCWIKFFCLECILVIFVFWTIRSLCFPLPTSLIFIIGWTSLWLSEAFLKRESAFVFYSLFLNLVLVFPNIDPFFFFNILQRWRIPKKERSKTPSRFLLPESKHLDKFQKAFRPKFLKLCSRSIPLEHIFWTSDFNYVSKWYILQLIWI